MANEKTPPKDAATPPSEPASSTSGEYVRSPSGEREPFRSTSTTRRALPAHARTQREALSPSGSTQPQPKDGEEQTLRSARAPQRIRMSLRMRRVAATKLSDDATAFRPEERIGLRLSGRSHELTMGREVTAGRGAECDVLIDDRLCSRQHAVFSRAPDGGALVRDLGSTNGTYVNGVRIYGSHRLARGDWTTIGNETLELCALPSAAQGASPTIPAGPGRKAQRTVTARALSKTDPGSPLLSLASQAAIAASRTAASVRAATARRPLDALLRRLERGDTIAESDAQLAGMVALNLGKSTADPAWLDYLFRLYTALRSPLPRPLLERLSETLPQVRLVETAALRVYVEALQRAPRGTWNDTQQQLIAQLVDLHLRYGGERS